MHMCNKIYLSLSIYLFLVIEKFTENTRFCLICNYLSKIIPAIQSRCTRFRFGPLAKEQMVSRLEYVIAQERYVRMCMCVLMQVGGCGCTSLCLGVAYSCGVTIDPIPPLVCTNSICVYIQLGCIYS